MRLRKISRSKQILAVIGFFLVSGIISSLMTMAINSLNPAPILVVILMYTAMGVLTGLTLLYFAYLVVDVSPC